MPMPKDLPSSPQQHDDRITSSSTSKSSQSSSGHTNAAAEALNSLYKRELIDLRKDWQDIDDVMIATMDWVQWYNEIRLHSYSGDMPPKEYEESYYKALSSGKIGGGSQT